MPQRQQIGAMETNSRRTNPWAQVVEDEWFSNPPKPYLSTIPLSSLPAAVWRAVPKDVLTIIAGFLDARSLCALTAVDTQSCSIASSSRLWSRLTHAHWCHRLPLLSRICIGRAPPCDRRELTLTQLMHDDKFESFEAQSDYYGGISREADPKGWMRERRCQALRQYRSCLNQVTLTQQDADASVRAGVCHMVFDVLEAPIMVALLTLLLALLARQLAAGERVTLTKSTWPLLVLDAYICFAGLVYYYQAYIPHAHRLCFLPSTYAVALSDTHDKDNVNLSARVIRFCEHTHVGFSFPLLSLLVCVALVALKCGAIIDSWSWFFVFAPLYALMSLYFPALYSLPIYVDTWMFIQHFLFLSLPLTQFTLLPMYLEDTGGLASLGRLTLARVFIPLWLSDVGIAFLTALLVMVTARQIDKRAKRYALVIGQM